VLSSRDLHLAHRPGAPTPPNENPPARTQADAQRNALERGFFPSDAPHGPRVIGRTASFGVGPGLVVFHAGVRVGPKFSVKLCHLPFCSGKHLVEREQLGFIEVAAVQLEGANLSRCTPPLSPIISSSEPAMR
jgi:hypothetical protein